MKIEPDSICVDGRWVAERFDDEEDGEPPTYVLQDDDKGVVGREAGPVHRLRTA